MSLNSYSVMTEVNKKLTSIAKILYEAEESVSIITTQNKGFVIREDSYGNLYYKTVEFTLRNCKKFQLRNMAIISWYLPKNLRSSLQLAILEKIGNNINLFDLKILLKSKGLMLSYLLNFAEKQGTSELFGNLLDETLYSPELILQPIKVKIYKSYMEYYERSTLKPQKPYIGVGYKDKGPKPGDKRGSSFNFQLHSIMLKIEELRDQENNLNFMIEGFLT